MNFFISLGFKSFLPTRLVKRLNSFPSERKSCCNSVLSFHLSKIVQIVYANVIQVLQRGSSRGLADKGVGLVIKFRVRIPKRSVVVLGRASNLKCSCATLENPAVFPAL